MIRKIAWDTFKNTGDINAFLELKQIENIENEMNKEKGNKENGKYNKKSVYGVAKFYCDNLDVFEKLRQELSKRGIEYPPMKLMDMCFWQDAYLDDLKQK